MVMATGLAVEATVFMSEVISSGPIRIISETIPVVLRIRPAMDRSTLVTQRVLSRMILTDNGRPTQSAMISVSPQMK